MRCAEQRWRTRGCYGDAGPVNGTRVRMPTGSTAGESLLPTFPQTFTQPGVRDQEMRTIQDLQPPPCLRITSPIVGARTPHEHIEQIRLRPRPPDRDAARPGRT